MAAIFCFLADEPWDVLLDLLTAPLAAGIFSLGAGPEDFFSPCFGCTCTLEAVGGVLEAVVGVLEAVGDVLGAVGDALEAAGDALEAASDALEAVGVALEAMGDTLEAMGMALTTEVT